MATRRPLEPDPSAQLLQITVNVTVYADKAALAMRHEEKMKELEVLGSGRDEAPPVNLMGNMMDEALKRAIPSVVDAVLDALQNPSRK